MRALRLIIGFVFISLQGLAQPAAKKCPCSTLLQESVQKISTIYAGFDDKVTSQNRVQYEKLVKRLKNKAVAATTERGCYGLINEYTRWFKDNHVGVSFSLQSSAAALRKVDVSNIVKDQQFPQNGFEGIWTTADKNERYIIMKDRSRVNKLIAVTIASSDSAWEPGMVKMEFYDYDTSSGYFRGMLYLRDFQGVLDGFKLTDNQLDHWWGTSWYREGAAIPDPSLPAKNEDPVVFKKISEDFIYLKLGRFWQWHVNILDSLIKANRSAIYNTKNLIIDLRGNGGGNGSSSKEMIQLIYTNPIVYPAWQYRSSPEFIKATEDEVARLSKNGAGKFLESRQLLLARLRAYPGQMVSGGDSIVRTTDSIFRYPERVAILGDGESGSSSEFFIFEGRQSRKVTVFGSNTAGGMDYGEVQEFSLSCGQFVIHIPWGRNGWIERFGIRIDNIGFVPDVRIPKGEDWIRFVVNYWSK